MVRVCGGEKCSETCYRDSMSIASAYFFGNLPGASSVIVCEGRLDSNWIGYARDLKKQRWGRRRGGGGAGRRELSILDLETVCSLADGLVYGDFSMPFWHSEFVLVFAVFGLARSGFRERVCCSMQFGEVFRQSGVWMQLRTRKHGETDWKFSCFRVVFFLKKRVFGDR